MRVDARGLFSRSLLTVAQRNLRPALLPTGSPTDSGSTEQQRRAALVRAASRSLSVVRFAMSLPSAPSASSSASSRVSSSVLLSSVWQLLLHVFIPASLANEAARQQQPLTHSLPQAATAPTPLLPLPASPEASTTPTALLHSTSPPLSAAPCAPPLLQSCDLLLVVTPGAVYREFRRLASHSYDHLAIALSPHSILHVGPPTIRTLPASLLLQPRRQPLVLRPALSEQQRAALVQSLTPLVGQPYDTKRVLLLIARLATAQTADKRRQKRHRMCSGQQQQQTLAADNLNSKAHSTTSTVPSSSLSSLICTDAILNRLLAVSPQFRAIVDRWQRESDTSALLPLDFHTMHSWSINDLHRIAHSTQLLHTAATTPFFTAVQLPPLPAASFGRARQFARRLSFMRTLRGTAPKLSSASSGILLTLFGWILLCGLHGLGKHSRRLLALLSFTVSFSSFLPRSFRILAVFLAMLSSMRQAAANRSVRALIPQASSKLRSVTRSKRAALYSRL